MNDDDTSLEDQMWEEFLEEAYPDPEDREKIRECTDWWAYCFVCGSEEEFAQADAQLFELRCSISRKQTNAE